MEEAEEDKVSEDVDSIISELEPAQISRERNPASAVMPSQRHRMNTRSVTSRNSKELVVLAATTNENVPSMSSEITEKPSQTEITPDNQDTNGENTSNVAIGEDSVAQTSESECQPPIEPCGKPFRVASRTKNAKKRTPKPADRSAGNGAKKKRQNKPRRKFPCKVCGKAYTKFYMEAHMQLHSGEKPFCCQVPECKRQFATEYYLRMHAQRCHGEPQCYPCDACGRKLASKRGLVEHMRTHSDERPFTCQVCGKGFRQPALLFNHVKTHEDLLPFQCEQCGIRYKYKRSMERHKEKIHEGISHSFPCALCERAFSTRSKLKEHQYLHEGNSPHVCQVCGKRLLARKTLQNHMLIHQGEKPFRCEVCGKLFRFVIVLKRHLSVHTGVKPFRCSRCGRQFIHRVYLERHKCGYKSMAGTEETVGAGDPPSDSLTNEMDMESTDVGLPSVHVEPLYTFAPNCDQLEGI